MFGLIGYVVTDGITNFSNCSSYDIATSKVINEFDNCKVYEVKNANRCGGYKVLYTTVCKNNNTKTTWTVPNGKSTRTIEVETVYEANYRWW